MEEPRVKILQKQQKKADTMINDLMLLSDALLIAIASAEGQEMVGQMKADLDALEAAGKE